MNTKKSLEKKIVQLEKELSLLKTELLNLNDGTKSVHVPAEIEDFFLAIERKVASYFHDIHFDPISGEITVHGERYVLFRSASVSIDFIDFIKERYSDRTEEEAISIGNNFLFDNAKVIGKKDAIAFHKKLHLHDPLEKLSAGPVHFAFTGWANVEIFPESNPVPDDTYFLKFQHHNSFEAQAWVKAKKKSKIPVCTMNCGYSAGWCEESFGIPLTTVEITCEAMGDDKCTFIMAPTDKIDDYLKEQIETRKLRNLEVPVFFKRKEAEEQLKLSLQHKEMLIQEIHHRVKNNLQVIASLLRLQMNKVDDDRLKDEFETSINRINTMAAVHELMYLEKDFDRLNMKTYFYDLTKSLVQLYAIDNSVEIDIKLDIKDVDFKLEKSIPLGLILNEITCNSFKHGLKSGGKFFVRLTQVDKDYNLCIGDTGPGMQIDTSGQGLGLSLIEILCEQLDAALEVVNSTKGLEYRISFAL